MQLAPAMERFVAEQGPVRLGIISITGGFVLCFLSLVAGVGSITIPVNGMEKQVGFLSALNWSVTFLVLFPLFLVFAALQTKQVEYTLAQFAKSKIVASPNGAVIGQDEMRLRWQSFNARISVVLWTLAVVIVLQTSWQWWDSSAKPIFEWAIDHQPRDWSTAWILNSSEPTNKAFLLLFSGLSYIYMGISLFAYLAILVYSLTFSMFLHEMSIRGDDFKLLFKREPIGRNLSLFYANIFVSVFLGLCAAFLMQVQVNYLQSDKLFVLAYMFQDVASISYAIAAGALPSGIFEGAVSAGDVVNYSAFTSLALAAFSLLCIGGISYALDVVLQNAKSYTLDKYKDKRWRASVGMTKGELEKVKSARFMNMIVAQPRDYILCVSLVLLSMVFVGVGLFFITAIAVGIVTLGWKRIRRTVSESAAGTTSTPEPPPQTAN